LPASVPTAHRPERIGVEPFAHALVTAVVLAESVIRAGQEVRIFMTLVPRRRRQRRSGGDLHGLANPSGHRIISLLVFGGYNRISLRRCTLAAAVHVW
jgi:hypothetical protein